MYNGLLDHRWSYNMQINKEMMIKIMGPIAESEDLKVSLFIVSKKDPRLKKLNLDPTLAPEKRAAKLRQWAEEQRFVAVIEMGDKVFAHANEKFAQQLEKQQDLSIEGKKVAVKTLTDDESEKLSLLGENFEDYLLTEVDESEAKEEGKHKEVSAFVDSRYQLREYLALNRLISDKIYMDHVIARMENVPGEVILNCLKRFEEARREDQRQKEADEKHHRIKDQEIQKSILKEEIKQGEIKNTQKKHETLSQSEKRVKRTRGTI